MMHNEFMSLHDSILCGRYIYTLAKRRTAKSIRSLAITLDMIVDYFIEFITNLLSSIGIQYFDTGIFRYDNYRFSDFFYNIETNSDLV